MPKSKPIRKSEIMTLQDKIEQEIKNWNNSPNNNTTWLVFRINKIVENYPDPVEFGEINIGKIAICVTDKLPKGVSVHVLQQEGKFFNVRMVDNNSHKPVRVSVHDLIIVK